MKTIRSCGFIPLGLVLFSCGERGQAGYETFQTNKGWGYNILADGRVLIHQDAIPGQADTKGFKTKPQAEAMARLVIHKLRKRNGMPSVTNEEVKAVERSSGDE